MKDEKSPASLSRREKEVTNLLLQGMSNKQIALGLGISERTVEFHLKNIYAKLQVASRVEMVIKLGKIRGGIFENPVESTVDVGKKNVHNGNQPVGERRWAQSLRNTISLIQQEVAMTIKISFEDLENYLRNHPLFYGLLLFLAGSTVIRYALIALGLFFWFSYVLLGLLLVVGCIYLGLSWNGMINGNTPFRPLQLLGVTVVLPLLVALLDEISLYTIVKFIGQTTITIIDISNKAMWVVSPEGQSYLSLHRSVMSDTLWLIGMAVMVILFVIGVLSDRWRESRSLTAV